MRKDRQEIVDRVDARLTAIHKDWAWLTHELIESAQTVNHWHYHRGIPSAKHAAVAKLLGWSVEQLLGKEPGSNTLGPGWPFPHIPASRFEGLTEGQLLQAEGVLLDKLNEIERGPPEKYRPAATERAWINNNARPNRNRKTAT